MVPSVMGSDYADKLLMHIRKYTFGTYKYFFFQKESNKTAKEIETLFMLR